MKILFVCSGNICRSPMAAEYLRHRAARSGLSHLVVESAGTLGINGAPASPEAIRALQEIGLDLSGHRSRGIEAADLRTTDLTVAMSHDHLAELARRFTESTDRRILLRAFEPGPQIDPNAPDLDDPIGLSVEVYREQLRIIRSSVDHLVLYLRHHAAAPDDG